MILFVADLVTSPLNLAVQDSVSVLVTPSFSESVTVAPLLLPLTETCESLVISHNTSNNDAVYADGLNESE